MTAFPYIVSGYKHGFSETVFNIHVQEKYPEINKGTQQHSYLLFNKSINSLSCSMYEDYKTFYDKSGLKC